MRFASPARLRRRILTILPVVLLYGCSDAPAPTAPRVAPRPHFAAGPVVTVTNTDDAGAGSLRQAILDAPDGATILFDAAVAGKTIVLSTRDLVIDKALTIEGPVSGGVTISGGLISRVFFVTTAGSAVLRNLSIVDGRDKFAGGILVEGDAVIDHSLIANNETDEADGGGIFVRDGASLSLVNSTVSGNVSVNRGGAITSGGSLSIRNSTIAFNSAEKGGGGIDITEGSLILRNSMIAFSMVAGGAATQNCLLAVGVDVVYAGRNISHDDSCGTNAAMLVATPLLGQLASNGGPTKTHALAYGPGVDLGTACTEGTDQRYTARPQGLTCDAGAFEFNDYPTVTVTLDANAGVDKAGGATVTGTITCSVTTSVAHTLDVGMSQTQKVTGKFTTIVEGRALVSIPTCGVAPSAWSVTITPQSGKFENNGSATGNARTQLLSGELLNVTAPLKVFRTK